MITLTRLHGEMLVINAGLIEFVEATPDTLISTVTGRKVMVRESVQEVIDAVVAFHQRIGHPPAPLIREDSDEGDDE